MSNYKKIFVVAGHGEGYGEKKDPGAVADDGTTERSIAKAVCQNLVAELGEKAISIGIENDLTLSEKIIEVNAECNAQQLNFKNSLLISVHVDWRGASEGVGAYYYGDYRPSQHFAQLVINEVSKIGSRIKKFNRPDTSSRFGRLGIIRDTRPLTMLLEIGSLRADSNQNDGLELLKTERGQRNIAKYAAVGIRKFANWQEDAIDNEFNFSAIKALQKRIIALSRASRKYPRLKSFLNKMIKKLNTIRGR